MGQVLSNIVRCICGEAEKYDPEWPTLNRPLVFKSCASDTFIHSIPTSSNLSSSNPRSDSISPTGTLINPFTLDPHGDTYIIGSLHQNPTPFPQISPFQSVVNSIETREEEKVNKGVEIKEIWMNDYCNVHKILLVGEGDFSFSASLAFAFGSATNIVATSLDSTGFLRKNYRRAMSNIRELTTRGCKVVHGVDATEMANHLLLKGMKFDRIVYNFPHAGFFPNTSCETQLRRHRKLVKLFLANAKKMITVKGEIHIRHKSKGFFRKWNLELLGSIQGLRLIEECYISTELGRDSSSVKPAHSGN